METVDFVGKSCPCDGDYFCDQVTQTCRLNTGNSYRDLVLSHGPEAYYTLDDLSSGMAVDATGHGNDCNLSGTPAAVPGLISSGQALDFSEAGLSCGDRLSFADTNQFTFEAWIRMPAELSPGATFILFKRETDFRNRFGYLAYYRDDNFTFEVWEAVVPVEHNVRVDHGLARSAVAHLVITYSGTGSAIFLDGTLRRSNSNPGTLTDMTAVLEIGQTEADKPRFAGEMDEIAFYPRALTSDEVAAHFAAR